MGTAGRKRKRQQQQQSGSVASSVASSESCLVSHLLTQIAWGVLSTSQSQQIARASLRDYELSNQEPPAKLRRMAALASGGKYANNAWRDLLTMLPDIHIPKVVTIPTPGIKNSKLVIPMIFPHQMFSCLFHDYPLAWARYVCPSLDKTINFWQAVSNTKLFKQHPLRFIDENRRTFCILD